MWFGNRLRADAGRHQDEQRGHSKSLHRLALIELRPLSTHDVGGNRKVFAFLQYRRLAVPAQDEFQKLLDLGVERLARRAVQADEDETAQRVPVAGDVLEGPYGVLSSFFLRQGQ